MRTYVLALALSAAAVGPAAAQTPAGAPVAPHRAGLADQTITYGELLAIASGALVGTTVASAVIDHGLGFVGTLLGAWAGDYYYYRYFGGRSAAEPAP